MRAWLADVIDDAASFWSGPRGVRKSKALAKGPIGGVILAGICLAVYLPGLFSIPAVDRDEARFAQASRQMFESVALPESEQTESLHGGGVIEPRVGEKSRLNKPPLIYWLQTTSAAIFTGGDPRNDAIWMYRIPSVLAAALAVLFTWRAGLLLFDPRAAFLGAAFLAICPMVVWDAHQARADQLLLACTSAAFWVLTALVSTKRLSPKQSWILPIALAVAIGLGVLAKGPITPMVVLLTAAAWSLATRDWRWIKSVRPLVILGTAVVIVLPWLIAVAAKVGVAEYWSTVFDETLGRSTSAKEGHWGPPGYHLVLLAVLFWPGVVFTALSLTRAIARAWGTQTTTISDIPAAPEPGPAPEPARELTHPEEPASPGDDADAASGEPPAPDVTDDQGQVDPLAQPASIEPVEFESHEEPEPAPEEPNAPESIDPTNPPELPDDLPIALEPEPEPAPRAAFVPGPDPDPEPESEPMPEPELARPPLSVRVRAFMNQITRPPSGRRAELFCLAWIIPSWIVFEIVSTKLPHYTLPLYPAIALLSARGLIAACAGTLPGLAATTTGMGVQLWLLIGFVLMVAAPVTIAVLGGAGLWIALAVALAAACGYLLWNARDAMARGLVARAAAFATVAAIAGLWNLTAVALPTASSPWITERLVETAVEAGWTPEIPIGAVIYHEDSLVFGTRALVERADDAKEWARSNRGFLIAPAGTATLLQSDARIDANLVDTVSGYNYSVGKIQQLEVIDTRR
ncbi:MAG: glycosyltransferase family 39 protein [Planctomycetota bacterium]